MTQMQQQSVPLPEEDLYHADMPVGDVLRRAREHYGQTCQDIQRALRIGSAQIRAIESGDMDQLPGRVYAIGFVRSYAEYLGMDGDKMVALFKAQYGRKATDPGLDFPVAASETKMPPLWLVGASLAVVILVTVVLVSFLNADRADVTRVPDVKDVISLGNAEVSGDVFGPFIPLGFDPNAEITAVEQHIKPEGIILTMTENSWVEIKDKGGKVLVSQVLQAGDQYVMPPRSDLTMSLGNAGGVRLEIDGQALKPLGKLGTVMRNIPLDLEYLQKTYTTSSSETTE